jgi:hypothetical protein
MGTLPRPFRPRPTQIGRQFEQNAIPRRIAGTPKMRVDPGTLIPRGRSYMSIGPFNELKTAEEKVASDFKEEIGKLIVAVIKKKHEKLSQRQTPEGNDLLRKIDEAQCLVGKGGGAKTEPQIREAKATAENVTASILSRDLKEEVTQAIAMPRDTQGRVIYIDPEANSFYVYDFGGGGLEATTVDVSIEMRPNPDGCTIQFPSGMIPVLVTFAAAALRVARSNDD